MTWLPAIIGVLILLAAVFGPAASHAARYRYDERNPFRKRCTTCGQQFDAYCHAGDESRIGAHWWEATMPVPDPTCACHKDNAR